MADKIQAQHMVVDLVGVLVEAAKGVDLVVPAVCHRSIDETSRSLTESARYFRAVAVHGSTVLERRVGHDVGVVGGPG